MSRSLVALAGLGGAFVVLVGCGPNCQSTCEHVYNTCGIEKPGQDQRELTRDCVYECETALKNSGELGEYNPNQRRSTSESIVLENDAQATAWMDCVWFIAPEGTPEQCEDLDPRSGYCAPI
ncbi:MAG: hypothetical protein H6737_18280 [Alphaproteobacteria bacterium]|nr:hypothetical protein [Alphaproteobacteria bacterium]